MYINNTRLYPAILFLLLLTCIGNGLYAQCAFTVPTGPFCAGDACATNPPQFTYSGDPSATDFRWDFGVQGVESDTSSRQNPTYIYQQPGNYTVTLTVTINGQDVTCTQPITIDGINEFTIGPDINLGPQEEEICKGETIELTPTFENGSAPPNATYLWSTGATTPTITVDTVGCYSVTITDPATGCTRTNKVNVTVYKPDQEDQSANQPDQARWYFGNNVGIRFPGGQPNVVNDRTFNAPAGSSSILNALGELLFYTDGRTIYDSTGTQMPNGDNIGGDPNAVQGVVIVPQPGCSDCESVYYIFTTSTINGGGARLAYSIVDMRTANNLGEVVTKNVELYTNSTERVIAVQGTPDSTTGTPVTWIVSHDFQSNTFRVYPLTSQGVGEPKTYNVGSDHGPEAVKGQTYIRASPDGTKLAVVIPGTNGENNKVEIFDFNPDTGEVSNPVDLDLGPAPPSAYGVEFGNNQIFVSLTGDGSAASAIYRYNISASDSLQIALSKDTIATSTTERYGALQAGPDGRIYLAKAGSGSLGVINNPSGETPQAVNFEENGQDLNGATSNLGLPNNSPTQSRGYGPNFSYDGPTCTLANTPVDYTFQAQPDRAQRNDGTPNSFFTWYFPNGRVVNSDNISEQNNPTTHTFPGPGTYSVTLVITTDCDEVPADTVTQEITIFESPPTPNLGDDRSVCTGETVTLDVYPNATGPAGAVYYWLRPDGSVIQGNETLAISSGSGMYQVAVVVGECIEFDSVRVDFAGPPQNFLGDDITLCRGEGAVLDAGPGYTYEWRIAGNNQVISTSQTLQVNPAQTTTYRVTVTDPLTKCTVTDEITVSIGTPPTVTATPTPSSGCVGAPNPNGTITLSNLPATGGPFTFQWSKNGAVFSTDQNLTGLEPGIYQVVVRNAAGCETTVSTQVNSTTSQLNYASNQPVSLTCSDTQGTLILTPQTGSTTANRVVWRDSNNQVVQDSPSLQFTGVPGTYSAELFDNIGCQFFLANLVIQQSPNKPVINPTFRPTGCGDARLFANVSGNPANFTFQWRSAANANITTNPDGTADVSAAGNYTIRVTSNADPTCITEQTIAVTIPPPPAPINVPDPAAVCQGVPFTLNATTPGYTTYVWTLPNGNQAFGPQLRPTVSGTYRVTGRTANNCTSTDEVNVTINPTPAPPTVTNPPAVCTGGGIPQLTATGENIQWYRDAQLRNRVGQGNSFLPTIDNTIPGTYTFYATQTVNGCVSRASAPVTLRVNPSPVVDLGPNRNFCEGSGDRLDATNQGQGVTYRWSTGQTTPFIIPTRSGTYSVTVTIGNCTATDEVTITLLPPVRTNVPRFEIPLCVADGDGNPAVLDAGPGEGFTYLWPHSGETTRTVEVTEIGPYIVRITNADGCTKEEEIVVVEKCEPLVLVPSAFTPNGDGTNDVLEVQAFHILDYELIIYNRWGEVVFASRNVQDRWDGLYLDKPVPVGSYAYKLTYRSEYYPERDPVLKRGGIMVIK